ncbi:MAG: RpiB/LacA/LacB family sugar-phosphate isomerase [Candidatus Levybacteria bacterium]|nr:RpiB/LacA/LacB family sugar-phosphate isomerase [Candidatus Levybacteria bacterium]MBP9815145.1 RpiB/LacA/LacB family sugar-phosphate isomerase [Candidatus Levybacteria bacterium]
MTNVYLGTDHAGFAYKEQLKPIIKKLGYEPIDCGAFSYNKDDDYPDFCAEASRKVALDDGSFGVVFGKSGAGECIVANKIHGIRAFLAVSKQNVQLAREHNDANVMSIGLELVNVDDLEMLLATFLKTPFSKEERHIRRIEKIKRLEIEEG